MTSVNFDPVAHRYDETRGGIDRGVVCAKAIAPYLPDDGVVLELGVGTGLVARAIRPPMVGIDVSAGMVTQARERIGSRVARADAYALPFSDGTFAAAYAVWLIHLVSNPEMAFAEIARVLMPGRRCIVQPAAQFDEIDDDIQPLLTAMFEQLQLPARRDSVEAVVAAARPAHLGVVSVDRRVEQERMSPAAAALNIESRAGSALWNVEADVWERVVAPVIGGLRALPEPDRERERNVPYLTIVLQRSA